MWSVLYCPQGISYKQVTITYETRKCLARYLFLLWCTQCCSIEKEMDTVSVRRTLTYMHSWTLALVDQVCNVWINGTWAISQSFSIRIEFSSTESVSLMGFLWSLFAMKVSDTRGGIYIREWTGPRSTCKWSFPHNTNPFVYLEKSRMYFVSCIECPSVESVALGILQVPLCFTMYYWSILRTFRYGMYHWVARETPPRVSPKPDWRMVKHWCVFCALNFPESSNCLFITIVLSKLDLEEGPHPPLAGGVNVIGEAEK